MRTCNNRNAYIMLVEMPIKRLIILAKNVCVILPSQIFIYAQNHMYKNLYNIVFDITIRKSRNNPNIHRQKTGYLILAYSKIEYYTTV